MGKTWIACGIGIPLVLLALGIAPSRQALQPTIEAATPLQQAGAFTAADNLPIFFEPNHGQADTRVKFLARGAGYAMFLTSDEAVFALETTQSTASAYAEAAATPATVERQDRSASVIRMSLDGGNRAPSLLGEARQPGKSHYLIGKEAAGWQRDVPHFGKVRYAEVYPGIDLVFHGNRNHLEYDFIVAPGRDPSRIALRFEGAPDGLRIDRSGNLVLGTAHGDLVQRKPVSYQDIDGRRIAVESSYALLEDHRIGFSVGSYDPAHPLVIDPVLAFGSYLGGSQHDSGYAAAVDRAGNTYLAGDTMSTDFPTLDPLPGQDGSGAQNVFVTKLNAAGSAIIYSTYLGGDGIDHALRMAVDGQGNAHVVGDTGSTDFPTFNALQPQLKGAMDAFVAKLDPSGSGLVYSTYLGGDGADIGTDIALDSTGRAVIAGQAYDAGGFPVTAGAYDTVFRGGGVDELGMGDPFIAKLGGNGAQVFGTYFPIGDVDFLRRRQIGDFTSIPSITLDADDNIFLAAGIGGGRAPVSGDNPLDLPEVGPPLQPDPELGKVFLSRLNATGSQLLYHTYFHGEAQTNYYVTDAAVDMNTNVYLTGTTGGEWLQHAPWQAGHAGSFDAFVTKLNFRTPTPSIVFSTNLGGANRENAYGIVTDKSLNSYVLGRSFSPNFPSIADLVPNSHGIFISKFDATGQTLVYSTKLGVSGMNGQIAIADNGDAVHAPVGGIGVLAHPMQSQTAGGEDAAFIKLLLAPQFAWSADFDGDGASDVLWRNQTTGQGMAWRSANSASALVMPSVTDMDWQISAVGDFNGDDDDDVMWRNYTTGVNLIWRSGDSSAVSFFTTVPNLNWSVAGIGDFDGDGRSDILWRHQVTGQNVIWRSGNSATPQAVTTVVLLTWQVAGIGDFDGDGRSDILWRNVSSGSNVIWKSGNSAAARNITAVQRNWDVAGIGDFNGDQRDDIFWRNHVVGANVIWRSAGSNTIQPVTGVTNFVWRIAGVGDYNGDGVSDILWRNTGSGNNVIWRSASASSQLGVTPLDALWDAKS